MTSNADQIALVAMLRHMQSKPLSFDVYMVANAAERAADMIERLSPEPEDDELPDQSAMLAQPPLEYVLQRKSDRFDCCHFPAHAWNLVIVPQPLTKAEKPARICPNCDAELPKGCAGIFAESDGQSCALNWSPLNGAGKP